MSMKYLKKNEPLGHIMGVCLLISELIFLFTAFADEWHSLTILLLNMGILYVNNAVYRSIKANSMTIWNLVYCIIAIIALGINAPIYFTDDGPLLLGIAFIMNLGCAIYYAVTIRYVYWSD